MNKLKRFPHYRQHNVSDCGPTSLRMIAKFYGLNYSAEMLRRHCYISRRGVNMQGINEGAQYIGFDTVGVKITFGQLVEEGVFPCILYWNQNHFVVCYGIEKGKNDIVLNGCFSEFAQRINAETEIDYIHIATDILGGHKAHWPIKYIRNNPFTVLHFSWCQIFYISKRYLDVASDFIQTNNSFYYEFLLPTMAYNGDFLIRQFENYGYQFQLSWGPAELYEHKYQYERTDKTFYHPIKNLSMVDFNKIV